MQPYFFRVAMPILILAAMSLSCRKENRDEQETGKLLTRVDEAIAVYDKVKNNDMRSIGSLRLLLEESLERGEGEKKQICSLSDSLFSKYLYVNADSAIKYARMKIAVSYDTLTRISGYYNLAKAQLTKGHETDAYDLLAETFPDTANPAVKPYYYDLMIFRKRMLNEDPIQWFRRLYKISPEGSRQRIISEAYIKLSLIKI